MNPYSFILLATFGSAVNPFPTTPGAAQVAGALSPASFSLFGSAGGKLGQGEATRPTGEPKEPVGARRIVVVVSIKNPIKTLTLAQLGRVFLRKQTQWPNGWAITVFSRPMKEPVRQQFSQEVFRKKPETLREYWLNLKLTRGLKPPKVLRSAKLVKRYLERVKGGVGYIYEDEVDETVRVVGITKK